MELVAEKYQQTEIGLIPSDWEVKTFGDIVNYTKGYPFKSKDYKTDGIRIIRVSDTTFDSIKKENEIYINESRINEFKQWKLDEYDLIFSTVGSKPPMYDSMVGKVILIKKENAGCLLNQNAVLIRAKSNTKFIQSLLLNHFRTKRYLQHIEEIYRGNANQASITLEDLFKFQIPLPPTIEEQTAIATALSDADALITSLKKLIAKKQNIKQGAMQQLLAPKENWEVNKLGEIAHFKNGKAHENFIDNNGDYVVINSKFISSEGEVYKSSKIAFEPLSKGEITMVMSDIPNGKALAKCFIVEEDNKYTLNQRICSLVSSICDSNYLFRILNRNKYFLAFDSGTGQTNLKKQEVLDCPVTFPNSQDEQIQIASILSDMDAEVTALEKRLTKAQNIKQAMMQQLLTGKIRLV